MSTVGDLIGWYRNQYDAAKNEGFTLPEHFKTSQRIYWTFNGLLSQKKE